ncbi:hypothetical protein CHARACLAT_027289 [Characodon lateralis]|uniref:Collagenase NC10/endostatin domain-containing protein n=1 Tax=Characodon lateralis TaxID=208331 RepID=A0ABU7EZQ4_9TELE|nr:hypothetical protein [Characodon lateralis]
MAAAARRQPEGSLVYVIDQTDLYVRVRDGVRQVQLGNYIPLPIESGVAVEELPPIIQAPSQPKPDSNPRYRPDTQYQTDLLYPQPSNPRYPSYTDRFNQPDGRYLDPRYPVTRPRRPPPSVPQVPIHRHTSGPALHMIALNSPQMGGMRGISGADFLCFSQAQTIGMKGTFRAFLSSKLEDINSIVYSSNRENVPIVNLKDEVLFDSWNNIFGDGRMKDNVSIYSFDGKDVLRDNTWPEKMIWHGSTSRGQRHIDNYCEAWRVGDRAVTGMASPLQSQSLLQQSSSSCSSSYIVLCVENSYIHDSRRR